MFAVVDIGGKQRRVEKGDRLRLERVEAKVGDKIELSPVLMVQTEKSLKIGKPHVDGARVSATVVAQDRYPRILVFKKKRRKQYKRKNGHRQSYTEVEINSIVASSAATD
ncbi:MAG: 50S ribosomal protein L21 [Acidobacteriota bacterium]|nr:50S ribosomal protein L21 [Acidobacteriota bacterium]